MNPVAPWMHDRPIRNLNPGDLRPRSKAPAWPGQDSVDKGPGGPFAIFRTAEDGWAALGLWCLQARYLAGMRTAKAMISVFAPPSENNTVAYVAGVVKQVGAGDLDLNDNVLLEALCRAIAHWEESHPYWTDAQVGTGLILARVRWSDFSKAATAAAQVTAQMVPPPPGRGRISA